MGATVTAPFAFPIRDHDAVPMRRAIVAAGNEPPALV